MIKLSQRDLYQDQVSNSVHAYHITEPLLHDLLTFRQRASCILGQAFHYSPENAFYIFNKKIYFII